MKILIIHNTYLQRGGEDIVVENEMELLRRNGHDVVTYFRDNAEVDELNQAALAGTTLWSKKSKDAIQLLIDRERPDIAHVHNTLPLISPSIYYTLHKSNIPVVQTLHNYRLVCPAGTFLRDGRICEDCLGLPLAWPSIAHACYRDSRSASTGVAAMLTMHRLLGTYRNKVDRYISLTEFAKSKFTEGGLPEEKIAVRGNFLTDDPGEGTGAGNYALFVGRLSPEKGVDVLIDAWRQLPEFQLRVVGDGPMRDQLRLQTASSPNIELLGSLPNARTIELMKDAALLVQPSLCYEGFPMTLIESMAVGTPVVASKLGSMAEIVKPDFTGQLVEPRNAGTLAAAIENALTDRNQLALMRRNAREQYLMRYSPRIAYESLASIYSSVSMGNSFAPRGSNGDSR